MAVERTLSIIKPDAVGKNVVGQIISRFEEAGLTVVAAKMLHMSKFGRRFRHAPILAVCQGGIKSFTPFARRTSYAKC